ATLLLRAIAAAPADDGPRLAFADWLQAHGEPERAEFIRVQCELVGGQLAEQRQGPLKRREKELLQTHKARWTASLLPLAGRAEITFRRGMIEALAVAGKVDDAAFACVKDQPLLRSLSVTDCPITDVGLGAVQSLSNLREVHLVRCRITDAGLTALGSL